ncbi:hypothetical protein [Labrys wisconsinensis]|uniref:Outer membrane protein beta-barrel domain-containing protein n=1 Tax=Labrys wisconsinensis TaxID=425677 RepID=A0ABU0JL93_9HYPH|nr:hypothetical protein [Labrys wisconsinensis]MDQ0475060.1 hypothetical protein [Labrys wisconsinensis]
MKLTTALFAATVFAATPAFAADLTTTPEPEAPAPAPAPQWSLGIEASPEFFAIDQDPHDAATAHSKKPAGKLTDYYGKISLSYSFAGGWFVGGSFQAQVKKNRNTSGDLVKDTYQYYGEGNIGYKYKWGAFSLTPSVGIGYTWGFTGINGDVSSSKDNDDAYYAIYLAGDWKLNDQWTWNVFNLRYRDAFSYTWITPKAATGVTYNIDSTNAIYVNAGYAWKELDKSGQASSRPFNPNYGDIDSDKWNIAIGYKHAF